MIIRYKNLILLVLKIKNYDSYFNNNIIMDLYNKY